MAIGLTALASINDSTDATSYVTASFTSATGKLLVAFITTYGTNDSPNSFTNHQGTESWTQIAAVNNGATGHRLMLYAARSSGQTAALTIGYAATQTGQTVSVFEMDTVYLVEGIAGVFAQSNTGSGTAASGSVTLSNPMARGENLCISGFAHAVNEVATPRTSWTEIHDVGIATPTGAIETQWRSDLFEGTGSATWLTSAAWTGIVAEVKAGPGTHTTDLALITDGDTTTSQGAWARVAGTNTANPTADGDTKVQGVASEGNKCGSTTGTTDVGGSVVLTSTFNSSGLHFFHWRNILTPANMLAKASQGVVVHLSSDATSPGSTNYKRWFLDGGNTDLIGGWRCYVIDPAGTADASAGAVSLTALKTLVFVCRQATSVNTALFNHFVDVCRQGTGLTVIGGTGTQALTLQDIYVTDNSQVNAWGILGKTLGVYGWIGKINVGTATQGARTIFKDTGQTVVVRDYNVASGFTELLVVGASGQKTTFQLGNYNPATGLTSGGCVIKGSGNITGTSRADGVAGMAHAIWKLTASDANQVTKLYGCQFSEMLSAALALNSVSIALTTNCATNSTATLTTTGSFHTSGIAVGMSVSGTNIPAGTYVSSIESATSLTMSKSATGTGSSLTMTFAHSNEVRGCTFQNFGNITANGCLFDSCTFQDLKTGAPISGTYAVDVATTAPTLTNNKFINCATALRWNVNADTNGKLDGTTFISGGTGHAIELGANCPITISINNVVFSGYGTDGTTNACIYNNSGKSITINITGTGSTPTIRNGTGASTTVVAGTVTTTITVKDIGTGSAISGAEVLVTASDNTGPMPYQKTISSLTRSGTTATATCTGHGLVNGKQVLVKGATQQEYNGVFTATVVDANTFTYTVSGTPATPATGSPTATGVVIYGTTNASGIISDTRTHASDQPITGRARSASTSPYYKTGAIVGTISHSSGFSQVVQLIRDE